MTLSLGATLIALRQQHGWTQVIAAHAIGMHPVWLHIYETDRQMPPLATLRIIADVYATDLDALVKLAVWEPRGNGTP